MLSTVHFVVHLNIYFELKVLTHDQLAALGKCFFHVVVRRVAHDTPKRVLHPTLCGSDGMVHTIAPSFRVGFVLFPNCLGHLVCQNVDWVNLWQLEQSVCESPCSRLPHAGWFMVTSRIVLVPNPLESFFSADHCISLKLTTRLEPSVPIHPQLNRAVSTALFSPSTGSDSRICLAVSEFVR